MTRANDVRMERLFDAVADALAPDRAALKAALAKLVNFHPEQRPMQFTMKHAKQSGYDPGDEQAPFISEAYLYVLLGKEDARTVLALVRRIGEAAGIDIDMLYKETTR